MRGGNRRGTWRAALLVLHSKSWWCVVHQGAGCGVRGLTFYFKVQYRGADRRYQHRERLDFDYPGYYESRLHYRRTG